MNKILALLLTLLVTSSFASTQKIEKKISNNKKVLTKSHSKKKETQVKIKTLANKIKSKNKNIIELEKNIQKINKDIEKHKTLLRKSKNTINILNKKSITLIKEKKNKEEQIVNTIIDDFSISLALKLASKNTQQELIDREVYTILAKDSKSNLKELDINYDLVTNNTKKNQENIKKLSKYIKEREETKKVFNKLKKRHSKSLLSLDNEHKAYQKELKKVIREQQSLKELLAKLNILKAKEIKKDKIKRDKLKKLLAAKKKKKTKSQKKNVIETAEIRNQRYAQKLDLDVRKIGSSTSGIKITRYRGAKTIAPLKSFRVIKRFGKYYDPVYKIRLFNESIVLQTKKPKSKVYSVLNGKVVYAKKNAGMLENVVIVQHKGGLHTIYSHLDEIAPTLRVGKWIKKGYVVGRVNSNLTFQATKGSYHINPKDLFKI